MVIAMTILRKRNAWRREPSAKRARGITREEQVNTARALKVLVRRFGSWSALAKAMGSTRSTLMTIARPVGSRRIGIGIALRAARVAQVPIDDLLSGAWPKPGACPHCGRG